MKSTNVKNKLNKTKIVQIAETLVAVHTHTHTGVCHLVNKTSEKYVENIKLNINFNKDRTMLIKGNMGLSLCMLEHKRWRAGPVKKMIIDANREVLSCFLAV